MTTHEIRFKGLLIEHMPEAEARKYVTGRLAHAVEGPAFDPDDWTIEPRKPWELHSRGNLVATFDSEWKANKAKAQAIEDAAATFARRGRVVDPALVEGFFSVHDGPAERQAAADAALEAAALHKNEGAELGALEELHVHEDPDDVDKRR